MTDATFTSHDIAPFDHGPLSQRHSTWTIAGAGAVTLGILVGSWLLDHRAGIAPGPAMDAGAARLTAAFHAPPAPALPPLPRALPVVAEAPAPEVARRQDPETQAVGMPGLAEGSPAHPIETALPDRAAAAEPASGPDIALIAPLPDRPHDEAPAPPPRPAAPTAADVRPQVEAAPLPTPRPAFRSVAGREPARSAQREAAGNTDAAPTPAAPGSSAPPDNRGFLEKFFGAFKPSGSALGYASPEDGLFGRAGLPGGPATPHDHYTAVYDISAHTVYMPDGTKLEAHSGLGKMIDNPRHVTVRNTGPTPPHLYDLTLREALFHGVQALRLNPVGGGGVYGRTGLLAHTFMLGPNGDSNGCVSFRDYASFLRAYQNGQVKRLVVVPGLG